MAKARKLDGPKKYEQFALVEGNGNFPIDGLRYDSAHPWKEADGRAIEDSFVAGDLPWKIIIRRFVPAATTDWSEYLWKSFARINFQPLSPEEADKLYFQRENPNRAE